MGHEYKSTIIVSWCKCVRPSTEQWAKIRILGIAVNVYDIIWNK
jgi:hypothetical protein